MRISLERGAANEHTDRFSSTSGVFFFVLNSEHTRALPIPASRTVRHPLGGRPPAIFWVTATMALSRCHDGRQTASDRRQALPGYNLCPVRFGMRAARAGEIIGLIEQVFALAVGFCQNDAGTSAAGVARVIMAAGSVSAGLGLGVGAIVVAGQRAINFWSGSLLFLQAVHLYVMTPCSIRHVGGVIRTEGPGRAAHGAQDVAEVITDQAARAG